MSGYPQDLKDAVLADYRAGVQPAVIAEQYGVHVTYPSRLARTVGESRARKLTNADRDGIMEAWLCGIPNPQIAAEYGCHRSYPSVLARRRIGVSLRTVAEFLKKDRENVWP